MEIIPAIIPKDKADLEDTLLRVHQIVPWVQIDVLDGKFVPEKSWPYGRENEEHFKRIVSQEEGLPFWKDFSFEVDLMIEKPEIYVENYIFAGFSRIIVHIESTNQLGDIIEKVHSLDTEIGVAIDIETPNSKLDEYIERVNFVQFMGIAQIGFQGEPFDERVLTKIKEFREKNSDIIISVDGGVSLKTAPYLLSAGADRLVAGSAIFGSDDAEGTIEQFKSLDPST